MAGGSALTTAPSPLPILVNIQEKTISVPVEQQTPSFRLPPTQEKFVRYFGSCESKTEISNSRYDKYIVNLGVLCKLAYESRTERFIRQSESSNIKILNTSTNHAMNERRNERIDDRRRVFKCPPPEKKNRKKETE